MSKKFRPGSMGAAEEKYTKRFNLVAGAIVFIVFLMTYAGLFNTDLHDWYKAGSGGWATLSEFVGVLGFGSAIWVLWRFSGHPWGERSAWIHGFLVLLAIGLGICFAAKFNFGY